MRDWGNVWDVILENGEVLLCPSLIPTSLFSLRSALCVSLVNPGATKALTDARAIGNSSYDPLAAVSFYYNQGRNELAANNFLVPITTALLLQTLTRYGAESGAQ